MSSHVIALWCASPTFFLSFPFIKRKVLRAALDAFGLGRIGSVSSKSLPPMSCGDKRVWGQVLSKACILEGVNVNAKSISLCSGILREVLTKTPMDFSMKSSRLLLFLRSPAMQWMHSHIQMLEMMHVRSELRFWASRSPGVSCSLNFALLQWSPFTSLLLRHNLMFPYLVCFIAFQHNLPCVGDCLTTSSEYIWNCLREWGILSPGRSFVKRMPNESVWCTK